MDADTRPTSNESEILSGFVKVKEKCETVGSKVVFALFWNVFQCNFSSQDGYADGLSEGRDSVFQEAFDAGYGDAFKFAFQLGQYKGLYTASGRMTVPPELEKTSRGECQTCVQPDILKRPVDELRLLQQEHSQRQLERFVVEHGDVDAALQNCADDESATKSLRAHVKFIEGREVLEVSRGQKLPKDMIKPGKSDWWTETKDDTVL